MSDAESQTPQEQLPQEYPPAPGDVPPPVEETEPPADYDPPQVPRQVDYAPTDEAAPKEAPADKREALERAGLTDEKATP